MFEALFILTTIDAGTRIGRFIVQEMLGKVSPVLGDIKSIWGNLISSALIVVAWGTFIYTGSVSSIWPMFGAANQLLATIALAVGTSFLINNGRKSVAIYTIIPFVVIGVTTLIACLMNIFNLYLPMILNNGSVFKGLINLILTLIILFCAVSIFYYSIVNWRKSIFNK